MNTQQRFIEVAKLFGRLIKDLELHHSLQAAANLMSDAFNQDHKVMIFGNGGSAAHAQHFAAELVCRYKKDRKALPALALTVDTSILTAQANDRSFKTIFSRQLEAFCNQDDVAIAITTSDTDDEHSANIYCGLLTAKQLGASTIGLFSQKTKKLLRLTTVPIIVPHTDTSLIQVVHQHIVHELCELVEGRL